MLYEISRRAIQLSKFEDIELLWHNDVLTVRCDSGLHLFDFSYNLNCLDKSIDFSESKILTSKSSPASELFPKNGFKGGIRNMELSQMVLDPSLWPHNKHLMEVAIVVGFEWSPANFIHNNESVLATVNSAGNIDIYSQERHKWIKLENLSLKLKCEMEAKIPNHVPTISYHGPVNFKKIKDAAYALETISICWCPTLNNDKSCYFVTAQKNGTILFWLLKSGEKCVDAELLHMNENKEEIVTMKWIPTSINNFILITSNALGQILAYQCQIVDNVFEILSMHNLWSFKDKMISHHIEYESLNDNIVIACNKHRHLLSLIIDNSCKVLFQSVKNINDHKITSVTKSSGRFYTSTVNREVFEMKFVIDNDSLDVHLIPIEVKSISPTSELYSVAFSTNNVIKAFALLDRTILCRKLPMKLEIIFYMEEKPDIEMDAIINNPTRTLTKLWDVIESLRCKTLKLKALPKLDYNKLYAEGKIDIYYGKVYFLILKFYNNLDITIQNGSRGLLPETSIDVVKSNILAQHAVELINKLYKIHLTFNSDTLENTADKFIYQCLHMAKAYLKEFCSKNKIKLDDILSSDVINRLEKIKGLEYTCLWCDNILNGFTCKDKHVNPFCSLSFTLIESNDYLTCRSCGSTVRIELYSDNPKCIFCDLYLCNCYLPV